MRPSGPTEGRAEGFVFGVCAHPQRATPREQELEAMAAAWMGAKAVRTDIDWHRMQPRADRWTFESFDRVVEVFGRNHIELQPIYAYTPEWAAAADWVPYQPEKRGRPRPDYGHWRTFVRTFAERYRDRVHYVEIWNEPDLVGFANFSADEYVEMLKIAYAEIKEAASGINVFTGGYTCMPSAGGMVNPVHMTTTLTEGRGSYDILAFHGHGSLRHYQPQIEELVELRRRLGVQAPWYANETARPSTHVGEKVQAGTLFQKLVYSWARGSIGYNWYNLRNDGYNPANNEHNFGLITKDFYPKAAYPVYNMLAGFYGGATYLRDVHPGGQAQGYLFSGRHDGEYLIANWNDDPSTKTRFVLVGGVSGSATRVDIFGNEAEVPVAGGVLVMEVGRDPSTLRVLGQRTPPMVLGEMVALNTPFVVNPGGEATVRYELLNPTARALDYDFSFEVPEGLKIKVPESPLRVAAGSSRFLDVVVNAEPFYPPVHAAGGHAVLDLSLPGIWSGRLEYPVRTAIGLPFGSFAVEPQFRLGSIDQVTVLVPHDPSREHLLWRGPEDLGAEVWLAWRDDALLLKAVVTDDRHVQPYSGENVWQGDGVQFSFLLPGQAKLWEIGLTRTDEGRAEVFCWHAADGFDRVAVARSITLDTQRDEMAKTTTYLAEIPLASVGLSAEAARTGTFRFNLLVNDNDGDVREGFIVIAPGMGTDRNPVRYPLVYFRSR